MHWKCPDCGFAANLGSDSLCESCGHQLPAILTLSSEATGSSKDFKISLPIGRSLLESFAGDEARFASYEQFRLFTKTVGGWYVLANPDATNPTFLNADPLGDEERLLEEGFVISVGPEHLILNVSLKPVIPT